MSHNSLQTSPKSTLPQNNSAMMGIATENEKMTSNSNGHVTNASIPSTTNGIESHEEGDKIGIELRSKRYPQLRHANSDGFSGDPRRRSASVAEVKELATGRLQEELRKAQKELELKDEECEKLAKVRDQMGQELEELTACLFEEANNMVQDANAKRSHVEKLLNEANQKIEVLQAEVTALKTLVLTSTPSTPNKHLHPQIDTSNNKKKESSRPFWKTHRRSTSHHEFTKEAQQESDEVENGQNTEIDPVYFEEFCQWREHPDLEESSQFLSRVILEDIGPCLNFVNQTLAERVKECVDKNTLTIEPIAGDSSYPRHCSLSQSNKLCNYKIRLGDDTNWHSISEFCRNRITSVCNFYTYIRYIQQGLVKGEDKSVFLEVLKLRRMMALARLGYSR